MGTVPPALRKRQFASKGKGKPKGSGGPPWDPDNDNDVDVPSKLPPGMKNTGDTDKDAGKTPTTVKGVRDMVAAEKKVAPHKKAAHRAKTIKGARKVGAMGHIPPPWLKKG
jgi:hypothetical protein